MKKCTKCSLEKEADHFHSDKSRRDGLRDICKTCANARANAWAKTNPERSKANSAAWYLAHPLEAKAQGLAWVKANPEKSKAIKAAWAKANPEKRVASNLAWLKANFEKHRAQGAAWQRANPEKNAAKSTRRRATKLNATPAWANEFFIGEAYALAKLRTEKLGLKWHVDHVVPLRSKIVCGLHVENNLQVIPAVDNLRKSNRHWPNMPASIFQGELS